MFVKQRVRPVLHSIDPYQAGLTDDEIVQRFGGKAVLKLNANENPLGPSPKALQAIADELGQLHHYPDGSSSYLRDAIAQYHGCEKDAVLVGNGSDEIIRLLSETFLSPDDEVIVTFPSFSQYRAGALLMGAKVVTVPLEAESFRFDPERLLEAVNPRTKLLYVCSPNNPSGTVLEKNQLEELVKRLPPQVIVIWDAAYDEYSMSPHRAVWSQDLLETGRWIVLHTFSKLYGLAGLRVGYALGSPDIWQYAHRIREPFNVNRLAQRAAAAALYDEEHRQKSLQLVRKGKQQYERLGQAGYTLVPSDANFILVRVGNGRQVAEKLMSEGVLVRFGFGLSEYIRISIGLANENEQCVEALLRLALQGESG
ncbi:histidinol-phosphate aminotransferase [Alicyclobacillus tolerans]|uniref:Histidinol-phosphate aminotransferase n=2 Tax=Alicyclobacillus tolerans TaxID=90970 RepID=A0A1M6MFS8_9BACL|nr:histidinol-phosphate aminotransferase [Alicyclobacillus montanus]